MTDVSKFIGLFLDFSLQISLRKISDKVPKQGEHGSFFLVEVLLKFQLIELVFQVSEAIDMNSFFLVVGRDQVF